MTPAFATRRVNKQRSRRLLAELLQSEADIAPEPDSGILRVRVIGTAGISGDAVIAMLLEELTRTRTVFPEPDLRMVYELPAKAAEPNNGGKESSPPQHPGSGRPKLKIDPSNSLNAPMRNRFLKVVDSAGRGDILEELSARVRRHAAALHDPHSRFLLADQLRSLHATSERIAAYDMRPAP